MQQLLVCVGALIDVVIHILYDFKVEWFLKYIA